MCKKKEPESPGFRKQSGIYFPDAFGFKVWVQVLAFTAPGAFRGITEDYAASRADPFFPDPVHEHPAGNLSEKLIIYCMRMLKKFH
jgi:hypothetical protein